MKLLLSLMLTTKFLTLNKSFSEAMMLNNVVQNDIETLTKQIYEDLRFYAKDVDLLKTEEAKKRARNKTNAYQRITAEKLASVKHSISKRSTTDFSREMTNKSDDGTKILNGFEPYISPISIHPRDVGFYYNYKLNKSEFVTIDTNGVHIYLVEETQELVHLHTINSGNFYKLSVVELRNLVIVGALQSKDNKKNAFVYTFEVNRPKDIKLIQTLEDCTDDIRLWVFRNTAHMLLTDGKGEKFNMYTWQESYFDLKTSFEAKDCTNVKFDILIDENQFFVAAACGANKPGQNDVYSYLYQCSEIKTCVLYQPFRTYTALDVKFFKIKVNDKIYDFLIFANNLEKEDNVDN